MGVTFMVQKKSIFHPFIFLILTLLLGIILLPIINAQLEVFLQHSWYFIQVNLLHISY